MACKTVLHSLIMTPPWRPARRSITSAFPPAHFQRPKVRFPTTAPLLCCSLADVPSPALPEDDQGPPQEAVLKAISAEVSKSEGRVAQTTNVIIGGTVKDDATNEWLALDQKVNSYPTVRGFTAIGTGGDDFVNAMIVAVESVLQETIPEDRVTHKLSSRGKYVSVNIGPIRVISSEQILTLMSLIFEQDTRAKNLMQF